MLNAPVFADGLDDIAQEFLVESYENLDELDRALVALEQEPNSRPLLASIFRTIHTIKGTSGFLAFNRLEAVTHVGENVLSKLRDGHLELTPQITTVLLRMVDTVRELLGTIELTGSEGDVDIADVQAALAACLEPAPAPADIVAESTKSTDALTSVETIRTPELTEVHEVAQMRTVVDTVEHPDAAHEVHVVEVHESVHTVDAILPADESGAPDHVVHLPSTASHLNGQSANGQSANGHKSGAHADLAASALAADHDDEQAEDDSARRSVADSSIRVDVGVLDQLMRMVGELVLTRNQVVQYVGDLQHAELQRAAQRLNLIASELQEGVMKTRMQPIGQVWSRLPRVVRDLGAQCGKPVRLVMDGKETELDRTLLEAVKDPLTHLVRNAVDHGLESPEDRVAAGKPAEGTLSLRAYHEGGQVVLETTDDGGGIDPVRVGEKAVEKGLVTRDDLARMSDREILDLIFRPGFSTAAAVTNVSGRGVGMDVVRTNIEKIGGTVDLSSQVGRGTTVRIRIPLTLAIIPALVVGQEGDAYAIPQANLLELVRLDPDSADLGVEHVGGAPVYRLRGTLLPLVFLAEQLRLDTAGRPEALNIVVLGADNSQFGLVVEEIRDTQEIVVQPLSKQVKHVDVFAGATITGDGKVALILDVAGLAERAAALPTGSGNHSLPGDTHLEVADARTRLLIAQVGDRRLAIPMDHVARLEEFPLSQVERAGNAEVVQYRDDLLRLVHVGALLGIYGEPEDTGSYSVVVHREDDGSAAVGLVVDRILDVIEEEIVLSSVGRHAGLQGSAELQSRVTDIVDVPALVASARAGSYV